MKKYKEAQIVKEETNEKNAQKYGRGKMIVQTTTYEDVNGKKSIKKTTNIINEGNTDANALNFPTLKEVERLVNDQYEELYENKNTKEESQEEKNNPLLKVRRMSLKSKELAKIRKDMGISGNNKEKYAAPKVEIDLLQGEKAAGKYFMRKKSKQYTDEQGKDVHIVEEEYTSGFKTPSSSSTNTKNIMSKLENKDSNNNKVVYGRTKYSISKNENNNKDNPSKNECEVVETTVTKKRRFGNEEEPKKEEITKTTKYQRTNQGTNNENKEEKKQGATRVTRVTVDLEKDEPKEESKGYGNKRRKYGGEKEEDSRYVKSKITVEDPKKEENVQRAGGRRVIQIEKKEIVENEPVRSYGRYRKTQNEVPKEEGKKIQTEIKIITETTSNRKKKY